MKDQRQSTQEMPNHQLSYGEQLLDAPLELVHSFMQGEFRTGGFAEKSIMERKKVNRMLELRNKQKIQQYMQKFCKMPLEPMELPVENLENKQVIGEHINELKEFVDKVNFLDKIAKNRKEKRLDIELDKKKHKAFFSTLQGLQMFGGGDFGGTMKPEDELEKVEQVATEPKVADPFSLMGQAFARAPTVEGMAQPEFIKQNSLINPKSNPLPPSNIHLLQKRSSLKMDDQNQPSLFANSSTANPFQNFAAAFNNQDLPEKESSIPPGSKKKRPSTFSSAPLAFRFPESDSRRQIVESSLNQPTENKGSRRNMLAEKFEQTNADEIMAVSAGVHQLAYKVEKQATVERLSNLEDGTPSPALASSKQRGSTKESQFKNLFQQPGMASESTKQIFLGSRRDLEQVSEKNVSLRNLQDSAPEPGGLVQRRILSGRFEKARNAEIFAKIAQNNKRLEEKAKESEVQAQARIVNGPTLVAKQKLFNNEHTSYAKKSLCNSIARVLLKEDEIDPSKKFLKLLIQKNQNPELSGITGNLQHILEGAQLDVLSTKIGKRFKMIQEQTGKLNAKMLQVKQKLNHKAATRADFYDDIERKSKVKAERMLSAKYSKILNRPFTGVTAVSSSMRRKDSASGTARTAVDFKASFGESDRVNDPSKSMTSPFVRMGPYTDPTLESEHDEDFEGGAQMHDLLFEYRKTSGVLAGVELNSVGIQKLKIPQDRDPQRVAQPNKRSMLSFGQGGETTSRSSHPVNSAKQFKMRAAPIGRNISLRVGMAKQPDKGTAAPDLPTREHSKPVLEKELSEDRMMDLSSASLDSLTEIKLDRLYSEAIVLKEKKGILDRLEQNRDSRQIIADLVQKRLEDVNQRVERTNWDRLHC